MKDTKRVLRPRVVCFGGGNALPQVVLKELKKYPLEITSITSMVDDGGSAGALRKEFDVLPAGDIRRHLLALADLPKGEKWKEKLWNFRFAKDIEISPGHFGHNFANVFLAGLEVNLGFEKALEVSHRFLNVKGRCLPATTDKAILFAQLENDKVIEGESEIDLGQNHNRTLKIKKVFLKPDAVAFGKTIREIERADIIIIGPGDFYSSLVPCFLPKGIKEAVGKSKAKKVFICPAMTKLGETQNFSVRNFSDEMEKYIGKDLDFVVYNNNLPKDRIERYKKKKGNEFVLDPPKIDKNLEKDKFIGKNLLFDKGPIEYNPNRVVRLILELCRQ